MHDSNHDPHGDMTHYQLSLVNGEEIIVSLPEDRLLLVLQH